MNNKMSDNVTLSPTLIGIIITGFLGLVTTIIGILASRQGEKAEAAVGMSSAWAETMQELRSEVARLHTRVDKQEERERKNRDTIRNLEDKLTKTERKLDKAQFQLDLAESNLSIAMDWMNEYTPALNKAGIEPLDISNLKFRGDDDLSTGDDDEITLT